MKQVEVQYYRRMKTLVMQSELHLFTTKVEQNYAQ